MVFSSRDAQGARPSFPGVDPDHRSHRDGLVHLFFGVNKVGEAVGRSDRIARQVTHTIERSD
ncbi:MAG: hypothetical protein V1755_14400 [Chloroflexota bacterium]